MNYDVNNVPYCHLFETMMELLSTILSRLLLPEARSVKRLTTIHLQFPFVSSQQKEKCCSFDPETAEERPLFSQVGICELLFSA